MACERALCHIRRPLVSGAVKVSDSSGRVSVSSWRGRGAISIQAVERE